MKFGTLIGSAFMAAALSHPKGKRWYVVCKSRFCPGLVPSEKAASFRPRPSLLLIGQAASAA